MKLYWSRLCLVSLTILLVACSTSSPTAVPNTPLNTNPYTPIPSTATQTLTPTYDSNAIVQRIETFTAKQTQDAAIIEAKTPSPTLWPTLIPSLTATPKPTGYVETYPVKQVWIEYGLGGQCCNIAGAFDPIFDYSIPTFVIYSDYQMILYHQGYPFLEKRVTDAEICNLLSNLNWLGLSQINSSGTSKDDPIYLDQARAKWGTDGAFFELAINGVPAKHLSVYQEVSNDVIPPVKNILKFLDQYRPAGMDVYHPDRLAVYIWDGKGVDMGDGIAWPKDFPSLTENVNNGFYLEGDKASSVYHFLKSNPTPIFIDQGIKYYVIYRPILPHEIRSNLWGDRPPTPTLAQAFKCP